MCAGCWLLAGVKEAAGPRASCPSTGWPGHVLRWCQKCKSQSRPNRAGAFQVSAYVTFTYIPLAKANHAAEPGVTVGGHHRVIMAKGMDTGGVKNRDH